ncbi:hypothetical protein FA13DRAFT_1723537 [Coprinellus micaceus]|uniref:Uncharacterized protein n=1 Tax=Coprinellus micaceus TaxID=71717 RepID=A0A4Y7R4X7_COPMI|nr:hypothetical protein FA13DRAFT_1723537 [Coprinellus micaceus]
MSSQRLATEIILHIVEVLGESNTYGCIPALIACATTNSALLRTSQEMLFRKVSLCSHHDSIYDDLNEPIQGLSTPEIDALGESTRLFLRSMKESPHLHLYVKDVTFHFCDCSEDSSHVVHQEIHKLPNIVSFSTGLYNVPGDFSVSGMGVDQDTIDTIVSLMQHGKLETLQIDSILGFPLEILRASKRLKTLALLNCAVALARCSTRGARGSDMMTVVRLKFVARAATTKPRRPEMPGIHNSHVHLSSVSLRWHVVLGSSLIFPFGQWLSDPTGTYQFDGLLIRSFGLKTCPDRHPLVVCWLVAGMSLVKVEWYTIDLASSREVASDVV